MHVLIAESRGWCPSLWALNIDGIGKDVVDVGGGRRGAPHVLCTTLWSYCYSGRLARAECQRGWDPYLRVCGADHTTCRQGPKAWSLAGPTRRGSECSGYHFQPNRADPLVVFSVGGVSKTGLCKTTAGLTYSFTHIAPPTTTSVRVPRQFSRQPSGYAPVPAADLAGPAGAERCISPTPPPGTPGRVHHHQPGGLRQGLFGALRCGPLAASMLAG